MKTVRSFFQSAIVMLYGPGVGLEGIIILPVVIGITGLAAGYFIVKKHWKFWKAIPVGIGLGVGLTVGLYRAWQSVAAGRRATAKALYDEANKNRPKPAATVGLLSSPRSTVVAVIPDTTHNVAQPTYS